MYLDIAGIITTIVTGGLLALRLRPRVEVVKEIVKVRVDKEQAPEWGTPEREEWHRQRRDFHRAKVAEAARATRERA